jgi:hypothetical protein
MLVLVCGLPGTGKSTIGNRIAKKLGAKLLRTDIIRKEILEKPTYTEEEKEMIYKITFLIARYLLESGQSVVLDGTFYKRKLRKEIYETARKTNTSLEIIECTAPKEVIKQRMKKPRKESNADYDVYEKIKRKFEPIKRKHITIDTSKEISENLEEIWKAILSS